MTPEVIRVTATAKSRLSFDHFFNRTKHPEVKMINRSNDRTAEFELAANRWMRFAAHAKTFNVDLSIPDP